MGIYTNEQLHTIQFSGTIVHLRGPLDVLVRTENNVQLSGERGAQAIVLGEKHKL